MYSTYYRSFLREWPTGLTPVVAKCVASYTQRKLSKHYVLAVNIAANDLLPTVQDEALKVGGSNGWQSY